MSTEDPSGATPRHDLDGLSAAASTARTFRWEAVSVGLSVIAFAVSWWWQSSDVGISDALAVPGLLLVVIAWVMGVVVLVRQAVSVGGSWVATASVVAGLALLLPATLYWTVGAVELAFGLLVHD